MEIALLIIAAGVVYLYSQGELGGSGSSYALVPKDQAPAAGTNLTQTVGAAVGALGCDVAGAALGSPQAGAAAAPACAFIGGKLAPYAVAGAKQVAAAGKFLGTETAKGATFVASKVAKGAVAGYDVVKSEAQQIASNPLAAPMEPTRIGLNVASTGLNLASRGLAFVDRAPAPVKLALAPTLIGTHVAIKGAQLAVGTAKTVVGATGKVAGAVGGVAGKALSVGSSAVGSVESFIGGGSSKLGRASNGKDVFPNDMVECQKRGATTVESCGQLYDLQKRKWPWQ